MILWTFYDFCELDGALVGKNRFEEWLDSLAPGTRDEVEGAIDAKLSVLATLSDWQPKFGKWITDYVGRPGILELRCKVKKVQYRPLGCYGSPAGVGRKTFVLLWGGIEKGKIPGSDLAKAEAHRNRLLKDARHAQPR